MIRTTHKSVAVTMLLSRFEVYLSISSDVILLLDPNNLEIMKCIIRPVWSAKVGSSTLRIPPSLEFTNDIDTIIGVSILPKEVWLLSSKDYSPNEVIRMGTSKDCYKLRYFDKNEVSKLSNLSEESLIESTRNLAYLSRKDTT